jgi:hypothetical protein
MRRHQTPPTHQRQPPLYVGIDIGTLRHHVSVVDAEGTPCLPKVVAFANTRAAMRRCSPCWPKQPPRPRPRRGRGAVRPPAPTG